jgi:hypothetical protein
MYKTSLLSRCGNTTFYFACFSILYEKLDTGLRLILIASIGWGLPGPVAENPCDDCLRTCGKDSDAGQTPTSRAAFPPYPPRSLQKFERKFYFCL